MSAVTPKPHPTLDRRAFIKSASALAALGALGVSPFSRGAQAAAPDRTVLSACHWGIFRARVRNGRFDRITPWEGDPHPTPMLQGVRDSIYSPTRIKYPMVRRAWLEHGPGADPDGRGTGDFVRVSWERAIALVAGELDRVRKHHGNTAIYAGSYGWKSTGKLHSCRVLLWRMLKLYGGFTSSLSNYSDAATSAVLPYVVGSAGVVDQCTTWPVIAKHTQVLVLWGCNPFNTCQIGWLVPDHNYFDLIKTAKAAGIKVICIDPIRTESCKLLDGEWIAPRPQTDVAMMLGIAHTLYSEKLHDEAFLKRYTTGFDAFLAYLTGRTDGTPKTPEWAAEICGIEPAKLRELARTFATHRTMLALGWSTQRQQHGEQVPWMLVTLTAMLGQIGLPGGGFGHAYHYNAGVPTHTSPSLPGMTDGSSVKELRPGCYPGNTSSYCLDEQGPAIPVARVVEMLRNPGKTIDYNGGKLTYPDVKLVYWAGGNPFAHHQDRNEMVQAWKKVETFVVHDFQWTASARHADIVLPVTTSYERNDIEQVGDFALSHIVPMKKVIEPLYEARSDYDIFADICAKIDRRDAFTEGLTEMDWIRRFYEKGRLVARAKGMEMPVFDVFWESDAPLAFPLAKGPTDYVAYADFRADPLLNALGTASGKFEIYSKTIEKMHYDDCPPHPTWIEPVERLGGPTARFPLHVAAIHPNYRLHSQLCGTALREIYAVSGREPCWMNPKDAAARGLKNGDIARAYNDRGQILVGIRVTDDIMPGVIRINEGGWYDPADPRRANTLCRYGDVNVLTTSIATSKLAQATSAQTVICEVEKFHGPIPPVRVFDEPDAQASPAGRSSKR
ncbi:trimethylamine-N-oxide reductase TorA [Burkholderia glumae]|uniref:trimethylamine-N-oxide reductase TorA n=1 Tax=Burkholderia glumae TaxID=337 RepID=UPI0021517449|nr:trimethylamine-N-oxide reductase TorA [Burkholderia glumae]